jgi:GLPGLI family protein
MKKVFGFLSLTIVLAGFTVLTSCNKAASNFEGVVSYEIKAGPGLPAEVSTMFQSMEMKTFIKGGMTRSEEEMGGTKSIVLSDNKTPDDPTMLISMMGHKYAIKLNDSLKKIAANNVPKIEYIDSANTTKEIAGYTCKKARLTRTLPNSPPVVSEVYYTTDLPYADPQGKFKGLKGMPMEYSINMSGMIIDVSAKTVEKKALSDSLFAVPTDYKQMSIDDMQKDLMKSMGTDTNSASAGAESADTTQH